ncbi:MAG: DUF2723 domain-containing protein [Candidatus Krumholzibacteria bacterium]|nr:DUF2723 domain-containing protein [Candidatus Krumholzibacteria bacterium]
MRDRHLTGAAAALLFVATLGVYLATMAVTVSFWDAGEFIAVSQILGIPHSPGTPMYVLVGRVFAMLPLPLSAAQRVNLLSAVTAALGVMMAFLAGVEVVRFMYGRARTGLGRFVRLAGPAAGAMFLAFSDTYWTNAIEAEVYALSAFVMGLCAYLALRWLRDPAGTGRAGAGAEDGIEGALPQGPGHARGLVLLIVYLLSLGIGFHLGTILVYGGILLTILMVREKSVSGFEVLVFTFGMAVVVADMTVHRNTGLTLAGLAVFGALLVWSTVREGRFALHATLLFALGVSVHLYMYLRSFHDPAIDMIDPETWEAMYYHLRREQYPPIDVFSRKASLWFQLEHFGRYFREQFRLVGDVRLGALNAGAASVFVPVALGFWGIVSNWMRERRTWVLNFTSLALNSAGLIVFLNFSDAEVRERDYFYGGAFYFFSIFIGIGATGVLQLLREEAVRRSAAAARWAVPAGLAILVCSVLPARYHWFSHDRSGDWIPRDYAYNILASVEPDAILFTNGDNDTYPLWYIQNVEGFRTDVNIANMQLLHTDWYIKQLRDRQPPVPISLGDDEIERLRPMMMRDGGVAQRNDLMVQHIIQQANWKRPIYFAVTVPAEIWDPYSSYLEMQGMVRRLVPVEKDYQVNEFMMRRNFEDIWLFRGVLAGDGTRDESVYKSRTADGVFQNFAVGAMEIARLAATRGDFADALRWSELTSLLKPDFDYSDRVIGLYMARTGRIDEGIAFYTGLLEKDPRRGVLWLGLARIYEEAGEIDRSIETLARGAEAATDQRDIFAHGFYLCASAGRYDQARWFVQRWLDLHPGDRDFRQISDEFDRIMIEEFGAGGQPDTSRPQPGL